MICTVRPLGITCATSLSLTVWLLLLSGCTRKFSRISGLKRPPARSFDRSFFRRSIADAMSASSAKKSKGSSPPALLPESLGAACFSSRAALPPFFSRHGEVLKPLRASVTEDVGLCAIWLGHTDCLKSVAVEEQNALRRYWGLATLSVGVEVLKEPLLTLHIVEELGKLLRRATSNLTSSSQLHLPRARQLSEGFNAGRSSPESRDAVRSLGKHSSSCSTLDFHVVDHRKVVL